MSHTPAPYMTLVHLVHPQMPACVCKSQFFNNLGPFVAHYARWAEMCRFLSGVRFVGQNQGGRGAVFWSRTLLRDFSSQGLWLWDHFHRPRDSGLWRTPHVTGAEWRPVHARWSPPACSSLVLMMLCGVSALWCWMLMLLMLGGAAHIQLRVWGWRRGDSRRVSSSQPGWNNPQEPQFPPSPPCDVALICSHVPTLINPAALHSQEPEKWLVTGFLWIRCLLNLPEVMVPASFCRWAAEHSHCWGFKHLSLDCPSLDVCAVVDVEMHAPGVTQQLLLDGCCRWFRGCSGTWSPAAETCASFTRRTPPGPRCMGEVSGTRRRMKPEHPVWLSGSPLHVV